jgi:hypothetical protein
VKDSGQRQSYQSGMQRDLSEGKINWSLVFDGPMLGRLAKHLTLGAIKYTKRNWMLGDGAEEMDRFRESAARHFAQWMAGDTDEDHAAAVMFNLNGYEYVKEKLDASAEDSGVRLLRRNDGAGGVEQPDVQPVLRAGSAVSGENEELRKGTGWVSQEAAEEDCLAEALPTDSLEIRMDPVWYYGEWT